MCQPYWLLGHTSNNLPLLLKPISHMPKPHLLKMGFSLLLAKWLSEWVYHILHGVYSLYLDIFLLEVVAYKVEPPLNVLGLLMRPRLLS